MRLSNHWSNRILVTLVVLSALLVYFVLTCERDLRQSASSSELLYAKRVVGLGLQGDLQLCHAGKPAHFSLCAYDQ